MHLSEPTLTANDLGAYPGPTLVMVGDSDHEIGIDHTLSIRNGLAHGQLAVVPNCGHGLFGERPELANAVVSAFLTEPSDWDFETASVLCAGWLTTPSPSSRLTIARVAICAFQLRLRVFRRRSLRRLVPPFAHDGAQRRPESNTP